MSLLANNRLVSKKRPSGLDRVVAAVENIAERSKTDMGYWLQRLFKNTFTYKGSLIETRRWCVKIQFQGRRKTFSLLSPDRERAAEEATEIYSMLVAGGWPVVETFPRSSVSQFDSVQNEPELNSRNSPAFWKPRLVVRKYTENLGPRLRRELSVRIEHQGTSHYFPLGTEDPDAGALRAVEIYQSTNLNGWHYAKLAYPREFTIGILWANNPFACTYTTLYTMAATEGTSSLESSENLRFGASLLIVEPDGGIRRALSFWVRNGTGLQRVKTCENCEAALSIVAEEMPTWLLVNQELPGSREFSDRLRDTKAGSVTFLYGVFEGSDEIFASVTGVTRGYMLRRRPPGLLLEPIARIVLAPAPSPDDAARQIRMHFQNLFDQSTANEDKQNPVSLTRREQEILNFLGKGYLDKEIATNLGISAWTVHSHLKRIYEKLRVHTRTEAVVKYLQK
jgi:DNA-binding NarL/FixJ family response regulator